MQRRFENIFKQKLAQQGVKGRRKTIYEEVTQRLDEYEEIQDKVGSILPEINLVNFKHSVRWSESTETELVS